MSFLSQAMVICAGMAILSYALYSIEAKILLPGREMASMPFVVFGILNYLRMVDVEDVGGSPVEVAYHSLHHANLRRRLDPGGDVEPGAVVRPGIGVKGRGPAEPPIEAGNRRFIPDD